MSDRVDTKKAQDLLERFLNLRHLDLTMDPPEDTDVLDWFNAFAMVAQSGLETKYQLQWIQRMKDYGCLLSHKYDLFKFKWCGGESERPVMTLKNYFHLEIVH